MKQPKLKKVLILAEHFAPAYKAGGIVRCLENMVVLLQDHYRFFILTSNNNLDKSELLQGVTHDTWTTFAESSRVFYASRKAQRVETIKQALETIQPDVVYINGLYSVFFTLLPLWLSQTSRFKPLVVLAPWGMLHSGCLCIKPVKKKIYFGLFKFLGLSKYVQWHATNLQERNDILRMFGRHVNVTIANALPACMPTSLHTLKKTDNVLRLVTISLVAHKKGHLRVIKALKELQGEIEAEYHIYGPIKDADFWQSCVQQIDSIQSSIKIVYHGFLNPTNVFPVIREHHVFVLHSDGENFCQSIYEALAAGRPVITSDQTPWNELQKEKAGWNVRLNDFSSLKDSIREAYSMKQTEYNTFCEGAQEKAKRFAIGCNMKKQYEQLF